MKLLRIRLVTGAVSLLFLVACEHIQQKSSSESEVRTKIEQGAFVVDVRTPMEFSTGHYQNAVNIPLSDISNRLPEFGAKTQPIVVYCRSGNRSGQAKRMLESAGFTNVINGGGLKDMPR